MTEIKIAPSILSADFSKMGEAVKGLASWGADYVHCDVMDGSFVPNITFGQKMVADIAAHTQLPLDVHLMIREPEKSVDDFIKAGAGIVTVHQEAALHLHRVLTAIRQGGAKAGVALNPATSPDALRYVLDDVDLILVMSVNPGFGGQSFIPSAVEKVREIKRMVAGRDILIEVDGGVNAKTAPLLVEAGADILVAGSYLFGADDPRKALQALKKR